MADQCGNCTLKGNLKGCKEAPCGVRGNWYAEEQQREIDRLTVWLEWIAAHSGITECDVPDDEFPYLNMPPNEGASAALNGESLKDCEST